MAQTSSKLEEASHAADERERFVSFRFSCVFNEQFCVFRSRKMLENQLNLGSDRTESLELHLKEARALAAESDKKYDEVKRNSKTKMKLTMSFRLLEN